MLFYFQEPIKVTCWFAIQYKRPHAPGKSLRARAAARIAPPILSPPFSLHFSLSKLTGAYICERLRDIFGTRKTTESKIIFFNPTFIFKRESHV